MRGPEREGGGIGSENIRVKWKRKSSKTGKVCVQKLERMREQSWSEGLFQMVGAASLKNCGAYIRNL